MRRQVGLGELRRLLAERQRRHADHRQIIVVDGDAALVFRVGQRGHRLHVGDIDLGVVEADRVVAELFGDAVALAVDHGRAVHLHFREEVGEGKLVLRQRLEQALLDAARHVDRIDHHHVPVARLRLLDQARPAPVPSNSLTLTLTPFASSKGCSSAGSAWSHQISALSSCGERRRGGEHARARRRRRRPRECGSRGRISSCSAPIAVLAVCEKTEPIPNLSQFQISMQSRAHERIARKAQGGPRTAASSRRRRRCSASPATRAPRSRRSPPRRRSRSARSTITTATRATSSSPSSRWR